MKIGFWELIVIVIVAFVFIGPDQLPVYAKKIGKMLRELKKYTGAASEEIQKNVVEPLNEIQAPLKEAVAPLTDIKKDIDSSMRDVTKSFTGIGKTSKEEAAKKLAETEEVTDLTEDAVEELPEQPAEARLKLWRLPLKSRSRPLPRPHSLPPSRWLSLCRKPLPQPKKPPKLHPLRKQRCKRPYLFMDAPAPAVARYIL